MSKTPKQSYSATLDLIRRVQKGDQTAFEMLLDHYAPLIDSMTSRFSSDASALDREDLRQEAVLCFYRALMRFDTEQDGVQFGLYAKECIRNGLISGRRKLKKHDGLLPLDDAFLLEPDTAGVGDPAQKLMEEEAYAALSRRIRDLLSDYENRIWWLYLAGRTAKEIAVLLGKDERSVQNAIYRIRRKLRSEISDS